MARLIVVVLLVVAVGWLGFRAVRAFDQDRHAAEAAAVLAAPDKVTHQLPTAPVPSAPGVAAPARVHPAQFRRKTRYRSSPATGSSPSSSTTDSQVPGR